MQLDTNPYLAAVMRAVRAERPALRADQPYFTRIERVPAGNYVEVWFRTGGCTWDHAGGCTMCNYGFGDDVTVSGAVESVRAALTELSDVPHELMISPSGGMWDPREVPVEALRPIYELAQRTGTGRFLVETRAETVTGERMAELRTAFPDRSLAVEMGLESSHDGVLAYCVNKGSNSATFIKAAEALREHRINVYANVCVGTAFLDRATAMRDAVASARWALRNGANSVVLFPLHVKPFTLLDVLHKREVYAPVSLWDLVEVLHQLGPDASARVEIAWYKSYYDTAAKVRRSPGGCATCTDPLVSELDRYRATQQFDVVAHLHQNRCSCAERQVFNDDVQTDDRTIALSVLKQYALLADILNLQSVWERFQSKLESAVYKSFEGYTASVTREIHVA